jgi:hypothetical protein
MVIFHSYVSLPEGKLAGKSLNYFLFNGGLFIAASLQRFGRNNVARNVLSTQMKQKLEVS